MKKINYTIVLSVLFLFLLISACTMTGKSVSEKEAIKIGVMYPLSGPAAAYGEPAKQGIVLAAEEINAQGGIDGRKIELVFEDSLCEPKQGVTAINKLINIDQVKYILGDICSAVVVPTAPLAEEKEVLMMAQGSNPDITHLGDYIFRNWPSDALQGKIIAKYAHEELNFSKIVVMNVNDPYGTGLGDAFTNQFESLGGEIVLREKFSANEADYRTSLLKIKKLEPDAVYIVSQGSEIALITKQAKQLDINLHLLGADSAHTKEAQEEAQGTMEGIVYAIPYLDEDSEIIIDFKDKFTEKFGAEPEFMLVSAIGYDAMNIVADSLKGNSYSDTNSVKENLYELKNYPGVSGKTSFDKNGDVIKPYGIYQIKNGKSTLIKVS